MSQSTADLVQGWHAECAILEQKIAGFRIGQEGKFLSEDQKEAAVQDLIETAAEFKSLIEDFSRVEAFPIAFRAAERDEPEPVVRLRFLGNRRVLADSACA